LLLNPNSFSNVLQILSGALWRKDSRSLKMRYLLDGFALSRVSEIWAALPPGAVQEATNQQRVSVWLFGWKGKSNDSKSAPRDIRKEAISIHVLPECSLYGAGIPRMSLLRVSPTKRISAVVQF
jgi:hypothetical protein